MTEFKKKSVVIAGGGLSGLAAAVYFDELGYDVTVYEKKPIFGGRTFSFIDRQIGAVIDNGQHLMVGAYHHTIELLEKIGAKHKIQMQVPSEVVIFNREFKRGVFNLQDGVAPLNLLKAVFGFAHFSFLEKLSFFKLGWHLRRAKKNINVIPKTLNAKDWLLSVGQSQNAIENFWEVLALATLNASIEVAQAQLLAQVLIQCYFSGPKDGFLVFPKAGLTEVLIQPILQYLQQRGQAVVKQQGVKSIAILDGKVQGFVLDSGEKIKADVYVSALPPQALQNALPQVFWQNHVQLKHLPSFQNAPIVSVNLFFDREVMSDVFLGGATTKTHWFFNRNAIQNHVEAPFHVVGVMSSAEEFLDWPKQKIIEHVLMDFQKLCPKAQEAKLTHALVNIERRATVVLDVKAAQNRPNSHVLHNFFVIGDWVDTGLPATLESAVASAKHIATLNFVSEVRKSELK